MTTQPEGQQAVELPSVSDFLSGGGGGGAPAVKFPTVGSTFEGVVTSEKLDQTRVFVGAGKIGPLEFWDDGRPKLQLVLTMVEIGTGEEYRMFCKSGLLKSVKAELGQHGLNSFVGGTLKVTHTGVAKTRAKEYSAKFTEPVVAAANEAANNSDLTKEAILALREAGLAVDS